MAFDANGREQLSPDRRSLHGPDQVPQEGYGGLVALSSDSVSFRRGQRGQICVVSLRRQTTPFCCIILEVNFGQPSASEMTFVLLIRIAIQCLITVNSVYVGWVSFLLRLSQMTP